MAVSMLGEAFELRILSGLHKGAWAALPGDGGAVVIGSDASCDFILRDSAIPARLLQLQQQGGAWMLQWLTGSGEADVAKLVALPRDKAVLLACADDIGASDQQPVLIVQAAHSPWPEVLPPLIARAAQHDEQPVVGSAGSQTAVTRVNRDSAGDNNTGTSKPSSPSASSALAAASVLNKPGQWLVSLVVLFAVLLMAYLAYLTFSGFAQSNTSPARAELSLNQAQAAGTARRQGTDRPDLEKSRAAITAIADNLKLSSRVRIETAEKGESGLLVRAGPLTDAETEALAAALSRLSPRPGLRVVSESALREAVQESVARQSAARNAALTALPVVLGRFRIQGILPENADRDAVLAALQTEFAGMAVFDSALQTLPDIAAKMVTELQNTGIASVQGQWQAGKLLLQAQMPKANLPLWEASLPRIAARYALPFTATLSWTAKQPDLASQKTNPPVAGNTKADSSTDPRLQPGLPFALQSIVSGPTAYVVVADGEKLLPGGSYQGWRLMDITSQRALFESLKSAKKVEVRR